MISPAYFEAIRIYALLDGMIYTEISADVIAGSITGRWGIQSNDVLERMGGLERLEFDVRNDEFNSLATAGAYTPDGPHCRDGWGVGLRLLITWSYDGWTKYFTAVIRNKGITFDPNPYGSTNVHVVALGWTEDFARADLPLIEYVTDQTLDQVTTAILAQLPVQPERTDIKTGTRIFPAAFDTLRAGEKAMGELAKAVFSEFSFAYTRRDRFAGETFVVEARNTREEDQGPYRIPILKAESAYLTDQSGNRIVTQNGDPIVVNQAEDATFIDTMELTSPDVAHGDGLINYARVSTYPRKPLTGAILWERSQPFSIPASASLVIRGSYSDVESGGTPVAAKGSTLSLSYEMNSQQDFYGSDIAADLDVVSEEYGTAEFEIEIENTGGVEGWVTLAVQGDGIALYSDQDAISQDEASILAHGRNDASLVMKYLDDQSIGQLEADLLVADNKTPATKARSWTFLANQTSRALLAFIFMDVGNRAYLGHTLSQLFGAHYVNGVEFWFKPGSNNIMYYRWVTQRAVDRTYFTVGQSAVGGPDPLRPG